MNPDLVIGCPVRNRNWVLPHYFKHIFAAVERAEVGVEFVFVVDPMDQATLTMLLEQTDHYATCLVPVNEPNRDDVRKWNVDRYEHMVFLRNTLLQHVRTHNPKWFLSLDSDVLLHPDTILNLIETQENRDWGVVGGRLYMTPSEDRWVSNGQLTSRGNLRRIDGSGVFPVDVVMAAKLMTPAAYGVDYQVDRQGEDIGFCRAVKAAGTKIGFDGRTINKHVMHSGMLDMADERVGF